MFYTTHTYISTRICDVDDLEPDFIGYHQDGRGFRFMWDGNAPAIVHASDRFIVDLQWVDTDECFTVELRHGEPDDAYMFGFILPRGKNNKLRYEVNTTTHHKSVITDNERCKDKNGNLWLVFKPYRNRCVIVNKDYTESKIITPENIGEMFTDGQYGLVWEEQKRTLFVSDVSEHDRDEYNIPDEIMQLSSRRMCGTLRADGKLYVESLCMYDENDNDIHTPCDIVLHGNMLDFIRDKHDRWL